MNTKTWENHKEKCVCFKGYATTEVNVFFFEREKQITNLTCPFEFFSYASTLDNAINWGNRNCKSKNLQNTSVSSQMRYASQKKFAIFLCFIYVVKA